MGLFGSEVLEAAGSGSCPLVDPSVDIADPFPGQRAQPGASTPLPASASWRVPRAWAGDAPGGRGLPGGCPGAAPGAELTSLPSVAAAPCSLSSGLPNPPLLSRSGSVPRSAPSQRMSWMRKDVRGLEEMGMVCWAAVEVRLITAGVLLGALCLLEGSTPALILLFLSLPRGMLVSHPPGSAFIRQAAKPPGPDWRSLAGVYALRLCLGSRGFSGCLLLPLAQDALPHGSMGSQPNLSLLLCPSVAPLLANHRRAFTMREGCLSEFILFGIKMLPGWGFWREEEEGSFHRCLGRMLCKRTASASATPAAANQCSACS